MTTNLAQGQSSSRRRGRRVLAVLLALFVVGLAACGDDDDGGNAVDSMGGQSESSSPRAIDVEMADNAFEPAEIEVTDGETVRFAFTNTGAVTHDAVIGDMAAQDAHEDEMRAAEENPDGMGDMGHDTSASGEDNAISVEPGETGELTFTFESGEGMIIGCHEPGHYDAGMKIAVNGASA